MARSAGTALLTTLTPSSPVLVFLSVVKPTTRPPGIGSQLRFRTWTLSTSHHQAHVPLYRKRIWAVAEPPIPGSAMVSRRGPRMSVVLWCQMLVHVVPPFVVTSMSAVLLLNAR